MIDPFELLPYFVPCPRGIEDVLATELRDLGARSVRPLSAGVSCSMKLPEAYRVCLWSRTASRVLYQLKEVSAESADVLYEMVKLLPWEEHIKRGSTIAVDANGVSPVLRNTQFTAVRVKDAICDRLRDLWGERPDVDAKDPDLKINVSLRGQRAMISIDLAGEALHRRGYRQQTRGVDAPMKENLAAAMLLLAGWEKISEQTGPFIDPMCGSGTLAIEAAMIAGDRAPGMLRSKWGFFGWANHNEKIWAELLDEADDRAELGIIDIPLIRASDIDPHAVEAARENAKRAGLAPYIDIRQKDLAEIDLTGSAPSPDVPGLIASNPPYGERLESRAALPALYGAYAEMLRKNPITGWTVAIITPDPDLDAGLAMRANEVFTLYNGRIESPLHIYTMEEQTGEPVTVTDLTGGEHAVFVSDTEAVSFANRLRKMATHWSKWARKSNVTCFRIYDADLPAYNVVIDLYRTNDALYAHVAEYAPPKEIDPATASARLADALAIIPAVLGISRTQVFCKTRKRDRGGSQYSETLRDGTMITIQENGLTFEVNLSDYLDTGIFLDQRLTRQMIREMAEGKRFLNLFAYTGTASVYAAAGSAYTTTTVDLSNTYLAWTRRNFELNKMEAFEAKAGNDQEETNELINADVLTWISNERRTKHRYDLIFCDPPTFSNSAKMGESWDVQRDHAELIIGLSRLLTREGVALFSCNRKGFKLERETLERFGVAAEEITQQTISPDFERSGGGHRIWRVTRTPKAE